MKLLVCDIEGTIFQPHMIKDAEHDSYIWTAIAECLSAEQEEINTQRKWRNGDYGPKESGEAYMKWVNASIDIHRRHRLKRAEFERLIAKAPYVLGVKEFFRRLNRAEYIPVFISGGMQNLNRRACHELNVPIEDSYASCEYFFNDKDEVDQDLTFMNTSNFNGKQELIETSLRKYGLGKNEWIFIGDGINDVPVAEAAPLSIGIHPPKEIERAFKYVFTDFNELIGNSTLIRSEKLLIETEPIAPEITEPLSAVQRAKKRLGKLPIETLERLAYEKYQKAVGAWFASKYWSRFFGIQSLLADGERIMLMLEADKEDKLFSSAMLQPFCSAAENMVNVTLALREDPNYLDELFRFSSIWKKATNGEIDYIQNINLKNVLNAYRESRNNVAHGYHPIPLAAAQALVHRTYEAIQRLELVANPDKT